MSALTPSIRISLAAAALLMSAAAAAGQALEAPAGRKRAAERRDGSALVQLRLALDRQALAPGEQATLAVLFDIEPGWHLYWMNPGDTGMGPEVALRLPEGVEQAGPIRWPVPQRRPHAGFMVDNVYEGELTLLAPIRVRSDVAVGSTLVFGAQAEWLVCEEACLPGAGTAALTAPVRQVSAPIEDDALRARILGAEGRVPLPAAQAEQLGVEVRWEGRTLVARVPGAARLTYFHHEPRDAPPVDLFRQGQVEGEVIRIDYPERIHTLGAVSGVVAFEKEGQRRAVWINAPAPSEGNGRAAG